MSVIRDKRHIGPSVLVLNLFVQMWDVVTIFFLFVKSEFLT